LRLSGKNPLSYSPIGNVSEHSETPLQGFTALQKYGGRRKHIQTVVSDSGLGIAVTLKPSLMAHYPSLYKLHNSDDFDLQLVTAVSTEGEISRFGSGRGLGFKSSRAPMVTIRVGRFIRSFYRK